MRLIVVGDASSPRAAGMAEAMLHRACARGHEPARNADEARLIVNVTGAETPRAHWRRERLQQFAATIVELPGTAPAGVPGRPADILARAYPVLLRTLSNVVVALDGDTAVLVTPELGVRPLTPAGASLDARADAILDAVLPLAATTFAIDNEVTEDLPEDLARSPRIDELREGGRLLASLGLLPSPVRLDEILGPEDLKLLRAIFGLQQISYGNVSVREPSGGFWMSGRGVDKSRLEVVGRDVLLVTGHDEARGLLRCRVPRGHADGRVSVDALEHALLYEAFPDIGAIVHAHAWIDGIASTRQNWPCGTAELARDVRDLVAAQPRPAAAEVGLRNHGVTLTGAGVPEIFARLEGRLSREVPAA